MKLSQNKLKQLINEVLKEASDKAPFGPFTGSKPYVKSQRAAKLSTDQTSKLSSLDQDFPEMSRVMDQSMGIDNPDADIGPDAYVHKHIASQQEEYRDIIANQQAGSFSDKGAEPSKKVKTQIGDAYRIGTWTAPYTSLSGGVFANKTGIYVLDKDGYESYYSPKGPPDPGKKGYKIIPITRKFNEQIFMGLQEGRKR